MDPRLPPAGMTELLVILDCVYQASICSRHFRHPSSGVYLDFASDGSPLTTGGDDGKSHARHSQSGIHLVCFLIMSLQPGIQSCDNFFPQVTPIRILLFNQLKLPCAIPSLELFFPGNRQHHVQVEFIIHQSMDIVGIGKSFHESVLMLPASLDEMTGHSNI